MMSWAEQEVSGAELGDARRVRRAAQMLEELSARPEASIPEACASRSSRKAAYRFMSNAAVSSEAIRQAHAEATAARAGACGAEVVLVAQDTTTLDFTSLKQSSGLGMLEQAHTRGLVVHSGLAMTFGGTPLGLPHQEIWTRDPAGSGKAKARRSRAAEEKESQKWLHCLEAVEARLEAPAEVWVVGDREADVYALFAAPRRAGLHLVVRAAQNRKVEHAGEAALLQSYIATLPVAAEHRVRVPRRRGGEPEREARLEVRLGAFTMQPPRHAQQRSQLPAVPLWVVEVREETPPKGVTALRWVLLTSVPVHKVADALRVVEGYRQRWKVERYHYVLKSGCQVEELQLESAERIERALALYAIVAWRLLWLCYQARETPQAVASSVLKEHELAALRLHRQRGRGAAARMPTTAPTLAETVRWIAELGGFLGTRKQQPGVKTLWRGLRRLEDLSEMYLLLTQPQDVGNG